MLRKKNNEGCQKVDEQQFGLLGDEPLLDGSRGEDRVRTLQSRKQLGEHDEKPHRIGILQIRIMSSLGVETHSFQCGESNRLQECCPFADYQDESWGRLYSAHNLL